MPPGAWVSVSGSREEMGATWGMGECGTVCLGIWCNWVWYVWGAAYEVWSCVSTSYLSVMDEVHRRENEDEEVTLDPEREAYYKDDPKKALKKYFDREGIQYTMFNVILYMYNVHGCACACTYICHVHRSGVGV